MIKGNAHPPKAKPHKIAMNKSNIVGDGRLKEYRYCIVNNDENHQ